MGGGAPPAGGLVRKASASGEDSHLIDPLHLYSLSTGLLVLLMIVWTTLGHKLATSTRYTGEAMAACLLGLAVGVALILTRSLFDKALLEALLGFNPSSFFVFLLPPIIFYAGLSVKKKHFFRHFVTISGYGIAGTYTCFFLISLGLYLFFAGAPLGFGDCLALGSILAATDSVATLQVISQTRFPLLYSLVFGEGVINDATSIVILGTIKDFRLDDVSDLSVGLVALVFVDFLYLFVSSMLLGLGFGLATAFILRHTHFEHTTQEVAVIGLMAYLSYLAGDLFGLSGIMSLFVCALTTSHYALHNISPQSRTTTVFAFQTLSYISEGIIFVYCGMDSVDPQKWQNTNIRDLLWMVWVMLLLLLGSRAAFVLPVSWLHNRFSHNKLSTREIITIWWAGLMRGAVSVALVYYFFDPHGSDVDAHRSTMITTTLVLVLVSILAFGAVTKPLLDVVMGPQQDVHGGTAPAVAGKDGLELADIGGAYPPPPPRRGVRGLQYQALEAMPRTHDDELEPYAGSSHAVDVPELAAGLQPPYGLAAAGAGAPCSSQGQAWGAFAGCPQPAQQEWAWATAPGPALPEAPAPGPAPGRLESTGYEYPPDSTAVLARISRWWKRVDEAYMQPHFGGPANSRHGSAANLADLGGAQQQQREGGGGSFRHTASSSSLSVPPAGRLG